MKKQVSFSEIVKFYRKVHRLEQDDNMIRSSGIQFPKTALGNVNHSNNPRIQKLPAAGRTLPNRHIRTINIPKTLARAPFLESYTLTPGQRRYLNTIANTYSMEHVRRLIQQHYMNVLHRCIETGQTPVKHNLVVNLEVESLPFENDEMETPSSVKAFNKNREQKRTGRSGKTILPKISTRHLRTLSDGSPSKHRKTKKQTRFTSSKKSRPRRSKLWEDDLDFDLDKGPDDSLSGWMRSLSIREEEDVLISPITLSDF